jgi:hypothetical protein
MPIRQAASAVLRNGIGYGIPARTADAIDIDANNRTNAGIGIEQPKQGGEIGILGLKNVSSAVQSDDIGRALKRAEHNDDPAVFPQVSNGLNAASGVIDVCHGRRSKDPERVSTFRRDVHVTVTIQRGAAHKEDSLRFDKFTDVPIDRCMNLSHTSSAEHYKRGIALKFWRFYAS